MMRFMRTAYMYLCRTLIPDYMVEIAKSFPKPRSYFGTKEVSDAYKNLAVYF